MRLIWRRYYYPKWPACRTGDSVVPLCIVHLARQLPGVEPRLTDLVLDKTIDELLSDLLRPCPSLYVSISVSSEDLRTRRFLNVLTGRLHETGIQPAQVRIEGKRPANTSQARIRVNQAAVGDQR
jgi:sensor c-di-GMP phosphodiesterase-like protein